MGSWVGDVAQAVFDPLNVTGVNSSGSSHPKPQVDPNSLAYAAGMAGTNPESGYVGSMTGPSLVLPDAAQYYNAPPEPRVAPFAAQWSYTPGKGPQWLEPVDNGVSLEPTRQGDLTWNKSVDNGWSTKVNNGPAKGNRF